MTLDDCPHCGEEIALDVVGSEVDYRPCCPRRAFEVETFGFEDTYGCTLHAALQLTLGFGSELREVFGAGVVNVTPIDVGNGVLLDADLDEQFEDATRVRFPLEEVIPGVGVKGWQGEVFDFVDEHHSHHDRPQGWRFGVAVDNGLTRVGVAVVGNPVSRTLMTAEPLTWEVTRVCVAGHRKLRRNACSKLYSMCCHEARKLGITKLITYTLASEDAGSLKSAGWKPVHVSNGGSWNRDSRAREDNAPIEPKIRWEKVLEKERFVRLAGAKPALLVVSGARALPALSATLLAAVTS